MTERERPGTDLLDLAYPYAMDAVAELERRRIEQRLRDADPVVATAFTGIVSSVREALAALTVLDAVAPPPALESALLRALDDSPEKLRRNGGFGSRRLRWLAAAVAVLVAIGSAVGVLVQRTEDGPPALTAQLVLAQPDVAVRTVPVEGGGTLTIHTSNRIGAATATFESVPGPRQGTAYQLWLVPLGGTAHSAGVLTTLPSSGPVLVTYFDLIDTLAVTVEPAAGSRQPTTPPIASVNLA
ncbi:anti-sigma factor domain-containing protein [Nocardia sp. NPDC049149]|uniref:anti-sigma factor n=1 Tax=Nocardia sp. NPDC049149 TaxID=3364315 RepID=UPI003713B72B